MYDTKHICTYHLNDLFQNINEITEDEKTQRRDDIYRFDILSIFNIDDFDDEKINISINQLYEKIKLNDGLREIMIKLASTVLSTCEEFGLIIMFSFDYLHISHDCISEYLETGNISKEKMDKFISLL